MGNLVATDWQAVNSMSRSVEEYRTDPLGNVVRSQRGDGTTVIGATGNHPRYNAYEPGQGRVVGMAKVRPAAVGPDFQQDSTAQSFDASGNLSRAYSVTAGRESEAWHFYGADDRLRVVQRVAVTNSGDNYGLRFSGVWEEYRYDPLGRRVMVRTRTDGGLCDVDPWTCTGSITRYVWAGDQVLWELKAPGNEGADLEATTASGAAFGQVSYLHAGGIDRPLVITKGGASEIPHQNWRGLFAIATSPDGARSPTAVDWPGFHTTPWHGATRVVENWVGSLSVGQRDASGQMYMRNRYYDPRSGQFKQPDPIGLAGGLNAYGFAKGDPVSYDDPYGLCPPAPCDDSPENQPAALKAQGRALVGGLRRLASVLPFVGDGNDLGTVVTGHDVLANERVGFGGRVAAGVGLALPVGGGGAVRTVAEAAEDLARAIGRNSVSIRTANGLRRVDLVGRSHGGVATPHVQTYTRHTNPRTGQSSMTRDSRQAASATMQDIRQAREAARRQGLLDQ